MNRNLPSTQAGSSQPVRFGIVGAGAIAQAYAQSFPRVPGARLAAVADLRLEAAENLSGVHGCPAFSSWQDMVASESIDAAIVCTPPSSHPDICIGLAESGVHILCEKPLSIDRASAERMIGRAASAGVLLTMASKFRYVSDVIRAKEIVTSGVLGDIVLFENAFTARVDMSSRWNSQPAVSGGGVLIDNGTHSVDIMRYFLGPIAELHVVEGRRAQNLAVEDTVRIFVRSTAGVLGTIDLSWSINKELDDYISIYGTLGVVKVGWKASKFRQTSSPEWVAFGSGYDKLQAFARQIGNFAGAVRGEETLLVTAEDGLASVEVIEAAYGDLNRSPWVSVLASRAARSASLVTSAR